MAEKGRSMAAPGILIFDEARAKSLEPYAEAEARALWQPAFDPERNELDRLLDSRRQLLQSRLQELLQEKVRCNGLRRDLVLRMPADEKAPEPSPALYYLATIVLGFAIGVSLLPLFGNIEDAQLAWGLAVVVGGSIGALIAWSLFHDGK